MSLLHNSIINTYSILILLVIAFQHRRNSEKNNLQYHLFFALIFINIALLFIDTLGRFDGLHFWFFPILNRIGNFFLYLLNPVFPSVWLLYAHHQIYKNEKNTKKLITPLIILNILNLILLIISQFKGYYYYIDENNIYHRGPLFEASLVFIIILMLSTFYIIIKGRKWISKRYFVLLICFPFFPIVAIILQMLLYGTSIQFSSTVFSLLLIYLNIQNDQINTDFVTGLNNRKRLHDYLRKKTNSFSSDSELSVILITLDNFKEINDNFGKKTGDIVLQDFAKILKSSLLGKFFIARFSGGDFCIVLEESDFKKIENIMNLIKDNVKDFNLKNGYKNEMVLMMEYAVYNNPEIKMEDFLSELDKSLQSKR